ncbi:flagellar biosynthesis protein FlhB [Photobacterium sp. CCB-ST2H9]|uniref:flagellar biosynthesis protein FlhB n=1 Tax=Photobacterium sp. CCB-ST2H9 TaxID=2912855 RepID=UPI0020060989|nr:flagellar biosynthesis protein FlhB [Photobacterium sp. CCB-ST2H9]UTM58461.1 flagellar biosynthesis protein FlhB [Photobacterium sp. CCB-ST2H9]
MASEEKTEEATQYKLQQAKQKGQVSKSMDVNAFAGLLITLVTVLFIAKEIGVQLMAVMQNVFLMAPDISVQSDSWLIGQIFESYIYATMPVLLLAILIGVIVNFIQTGGIFSFHPIKPDIKKINPIQGFKKLFSLKSLFELVKNLLRLSLVSVLAYMIFYDEIFTLPDSISYSLSGTLDKVNALLIQTIVFFILAMVPFTLFDLIFQRWSFRKEMRMSKKEVKDEYKNQEGDPEIRSKRKQIQKELRGKLGALSNVPSADMVITNPTFVAVALKYDPKTMTAPKVVSKGKGQLAYQIRKTARHHQVVMKTNIPLARVLYQKVKINAEIPPELYDQVAEIYRWYFNTQHQ